MNITRSFNRRFVQLLAAVLTNQELLNLTSGRLYKGSAKNLCAPGLNCYSCPAATLSCPLGALQAAGGTAGYGFSFYVGGFLLLLGVLWGRLACGFLCPFGLLQDLLSKLPMQKKKLFPPLRYVKYLLLVVFVLLLPVVLLMVNGVGAPAFCEYICPAGTLEAAVPLLLTHVEYRQAIGGLFVLKSVILVAVLVGCLFISRFFCKMLCPLGAIYGLLNRVSICRLHLDEKSCVSCGACRKVCPMDIDPVAQLHSPECILCGQCVEACPQKALHLGIKAPAAKTAADTH
ncbi:4Fe-4S binding protein [Selenomonas ruminantium]|uniref:4Fe-4S binding domain-containing protein n=1 Tax=Selenomonas ruminantium TaxID=971 RepID=A0A1K1LYP9_SELRU|nr:4Fe-4S binding protein [Selenomonas ruminantium]SFW16004.1 4Fe-4S binding domain-containing protein [Selenomonas ruminantium]